jgi:CheY-like chemotaxis protein
VAQLLELSKLDFQQREYLKILRSSGKSLLVIIDDVLDFSKIEAGKLELVSSDFDLREEMLLCLGIFREEACRKGLEFEVDIIPDRPVLVRGDSVRVRQILSNLVSNAIKFTAHGRIGVSAVVSQTASGHLRLDCKVSDTGIGVPHNHRDRLFQSFSQVDASIARQYGGSGLGLAICQRLCEAMDGDIDVADQLGDGVCFQFFVLLEAAVEYSVPSDRLEVQTGHTYDFAHLRVLVADDNQVNRAIAAAMLYTLGIRADTCENGEQAVTLHEQNGYELIFMDMQMPVMDGLAATRAIRSKGGLPQPYIIAMTANAFGSDNDLCIRAGMNDFLSKPIVLEVVRLKLQMVFAGQKRTA